MNKKEHTEQLADFKKITNEILSSEKETRAFLVKAGIHTKTGRLTKHYSESKSPIGYKAK